MSSETDRLLNNEDKSPRFYKSNSMCNTPCCLKSPCCRLGCKIILVILCVLNILVGIAVIVFDCLIIFTTEHWKKYSGTRHAIRLTSVILHFFIMPIITWSVTLTNFKTECSCCGICDCCPCNGGIETGDNCNCCIFRKTHETTMINMRNKRGTEMSDRDRQNRYESSNSLNAGQTPATDQKTQSYCNFGYIALILLHFIAPLCYATVAGAACALSIGESKNTTDRCLNETSTCHRYYHEYFYNTAVFYGLSIIVTALAIFCSIQTFLDHAYKHEYLRREVQQLSRVRQNNAIREFIKMVNNSFFEITCEDQKNLSRANFFSGAFIIDSIFYGTAYLLYMYIEGILDSKPRIIIVTFLGVSGLLLLGFMVYMNSQIDKNKDTLLYLQSYQNLIGQDLLNSSAEDTNKLNKNELSSLQTIVNYFDSYAHIFSYVPKKTTLIVAVLTLLAQKIVPSILKDHGILE